MPAQFRKEWKLAAYAFAVTEILQISGIHKQLFDVFQHPLGFSKDRLYGAFSLYGVSEAALRQTITSDVTHTLVRGYRDLAVKMEILSVPSFVIGGKQKVVPNHFGGLQEALEICSRLVHEANRTG